MPLSRRLLDSAPIQPISALWPERADLAFTNALTQDLPCILHGCPTPMFGIPYFNCRKPDPSCRLPQLLWCRHHTVHRHRHAEDSAGPASARSRFPIPARHSALTDQPLSLMTCPLRLPHLFSHLNSSISTSHLNFSSQLHISTRASGFSHLNSSIQVPGSS